MRKLMSDKNESFNIIMSKGEESESKNIKWTQDIRGKPQKSDEKPRFEQERIILALLSFVLYGKRGNPCTIRMFFLKRETLFSTSLSYQLSTLFLKDLLGFLP